jgi:hypothetical protein
MSCPFQERLLMPIPFTFPRSSLTFWDFTVMPLLPLPYLIASSIDSLISFVSAGATDGASYRADFCTGAAPTLS